MTENELAKITVDIAYKIHIYLGPGLLESVYESAFAHELKREVFNLRDNNLSRRGMMEFV